jgi:hypothetical protein
MASFCPESLRKSEVNSSFKRLVVDTFDSVLDL